jgi:predicted 2-oxoglutarate/Fe(II)-dependent dioxygenase YbiX
MFDTLLIPDFLGAETAARIAGELENAAGAAAGVYGRGSDAQFDGHVRRAELLSPPSATAARVELLLKNAQPSIAQHFGVVLSGFEPPQFLRYFAGGFFVPHQDGNTPLLRDASAGRRVSVVIFLNATYGGGALTLHGRYPDFNARHIVPAEPGLLVAFRSETTHEVTPVTHGERYTIVSWYRG